MPKTFSGSSSLDNALAGFAAGATSTICLHPLDLVKTRFQIDDAVKGSNGKRLGATFNALKTIFVKNKFIGLYRGISPSFVGSTLSWGIYFYWYDLIKRKKANGDRLTKLTAIQHLTSSAEAGLITALITNPLWVVKTRMCATNKSDPGAYKGLFGIIPSLLGTSHGAIQFMIYEEMKKWRLKITPDKDRERLDNFEYLLMSGSSKAFASITTYPYQVIRARLQNQKNEAKYLGIFDTMRKILRKEGFLGFYKGLAPNILKVLPGTCTTFLVYENVNSFFKEHARYD
ncbi:9554_t:CDS:2 [Diversispora eburnea]|uniref:9554_t:CDS:1 n=1 Tax=Diversispora eburnea TaxID=1213867 RepID=A0A9N8V149_9GLOM|nr:9554_t:CDS:2 [Diversispora eburnea]